MLSYKTGIPTTPPLYDQQRSGVLAGLAAGAPWGMAGEQNFNDHYNALSQRNAVEADRAAQMANAEYMQNAQNLQSQMATRGLQQMAQAQQNQDSLGTRRYRDALDTSAGLLGGVNSILRGLFS